jgi:hypothetical protein
MPAKKGNKYAAGNKGGGRETVYKEEYANIAYNMCLLGATDKELANCFDVSEQTINVWKQKHEEFKLALKRGKLEADAVIASKLYHRAKGYEHPEDKIFNDNGTPLVVPTIKHYPPDTTAAIFWLKNRQPDKWRDKSEVESKNTNTNIDIDYSILPPEALEEIAKAQGQEEVMRIVGKYRK